MEDNVYFYFIDKKMVSIQDDIIFIKEKNNEKVILYCEALNIFWRDIINGELEDDFEINKPIYKPASLEEINESGFLSSVQGVIKYTRDGSVNILF